MYVHTYIICIDVLRVVIINIICAIHHRLFTGMRLIRKYYSLYCAEIQLLLLYEWKHIVFLHYAYIVCYCLCHMICEINAYLLYFETNSYFFHFELFLHLEKFVVHLILEKYLKKLLRYA